MLPGSPLSESFQNVYVDSTQEKPNDLSGSQGSINSNLFTDVLVNTCQYGSQL